MSGHDVNARLDEVVQKGRAEFPDFDEASHYVVAMTTDKTALRHALGGLGDDAHRVVARLADDPDEAARILALRGSKMGIALGQFAARQAAASTAAAVTPKTPAPKPNGPDLYDPKLPMKDWSAAYDKRQTDKQQARVARAKEDARWRR